MYVSISGLTAPYGNLSSRRAKVLVSFFVVPSASLSLVLLLAEAMGSTSSPYSSPRTHLSVPLEDLAASRLKVPTPCHPLLSSQGPQGTLCVGSQSLHTGLGSIFTAGPTLEAASGIGAQRQDLIPGRNQLHKQTYTQSGPPPRSQSQMLGILTGMGDRAHCYCPLNQGHILEQDSLHWE